MQTVALAPIFRRTPGWASVFVAMAIGCGANGTTEPDGTGGGGASSSGGASGTVGSGGHGATGAGGASATGGASPGGSAGTAGSGGSAGSAGTAGKAGTAGSGGAPPRDAAAGSGGVAQDASGDQGTVSPDANRDVASPRDASSENAGNDVRDASAESASDAPSGGFSDARSTTHLDIPAHDPAIIWDGTQYSLFATGGSLGIRNSAELYNQAAQWVKEHGG